MDIVFDMPGIDVGLSTVDQLEVVFGEPAEKLCRLGDPGAEAPPAADGEWIALIVRRIRQLLTELGEPCGSPDENGGFGAPRAQDGVGSGRIRRAGSSRRNQGLDDWWLPEIWYFAKSSRKNSVSSVLAR